MILICVFLMGEVASLVTLSMDDARQSLFKESKHESR